MLAPVLGDPLGLALGHPQGDLYGHVWSRWWPAHAVRHGQNPLWTPLLAWPEGGRFYPIDLLGALAFLPVAGVPMATLAHNLLAWLNLALGCWGAWLLAAHVSRSRAAALVAGVGYGLSPFALANHHNGVTELTWLFPLPLALLALRRRRAVAGGVLLAVASLANWYYAVVAFGMAVLRRPPLLALAIAAALVLPAALEFRAYLQDPRALVSPVQASAERPLETRIAPALREYVDPRSPTFLPEPYHHTVYPGWTLLALAAAGGWRRRDGPWWAACAALFAALSMGPYLTPWSPDGPVHPVQPLVPLPLKWLSVGPLQALNFPYRLFLGAQLALAVLAALSVARYRRPVILACAALVLAESLLSSPAPFPVAAAPMPRGAPTQATAVVDLPLVAGQGSLPQRVKETWGRYLVAQIDHGRPIPYGIANTLPGAWGEDPFLVQVLVRSPFARDLVPAGESLPAPGPLEIPEGVEVREHLTPSR